MDIVLCVCTLSFSSALITFWRSSFCQIHNKYTAGYLQRYFYLVCYEAWIMSLGRCAQLPSVCFPCVVCSALASFPFLNDVSVLPFRNNGMNFFGVLVQ